ncbi:Retrovirus-related Pol polyprotein from transposon 297 [Araneus ventricosus]|uniref:RNA-directed DNA polymerase n=1 Tax=Araneus ventricosus TaxID=182803 RepID=A0A4Y2DPR5_ARAVE|nr:Retrovirus-related Pol polyprotein from transposon 297 [Araneus ventricosus]
MTQNWKSLWIAAAVTISAVGVASVAGLIWKKKKRSFVKVGTVSKLHFFPVKGLKSIEVEKGKCTELGFEVDGLLDRSFMLIDSEGVLMSQKKAPSLALLTAQIDGKTLIISTPSGEKLKVEIKDSASANDKIVPCRIVNDLTKAVDCGDEAASFFQSYLNMPGVRLLRYFPKMIEREYSPTGTRRPFDLELRKENPFDVVSSANGWNNFVKASQLVTSLRGSAAEVLQGIPSDKLTDLTTIENSLEARFGDRHLTQFYRTELKTRRQKPGESLQVLAADVERLISLVYAECPQDVRDSLAAQYAIRDEDTQHATRLMDAKDMKSALAYSIRYEAAKTVSKTSRNVRSIEIEDGTGKEKDGKFDCLLKTLEKLLNSHVAGKKTSLRNPNVTCWKCNKKGHVQRECQTISPNQEKLMYDRLTGRRLPFLNKTPEKGLKVSALCGGRNGLYLERSICGIPCLMLVDTGANVTLVTTDLAQKLKENFIYTAPNISLKTATGKKAEIHGKLDAAIECGSRKFQHRIYVADIIDPCILGLIQNLTSREAIPVRVLNLDNKPKTVDKGAVIATCEPVVDTVAGPQEFSESLRLLSILKNLEGLNEEQRTAVKELLQEFQNLFSASDSDVGRCNMTQHRINTGNNPPIKQYPRRLPLAKKEETERLVKEMMDNGIIEESSGPWASPIVLVKKKDESTRFCVDYRKLNEITIKDSYPLPRIDDTLDALDGSQWFSTLDLKSGYWQVEIQPEDKEKTAFTTGQGLWQFKVMPFGLCSDPATFERLMETVLRGLMSEACLVYLDDIIIVGRTFAEHLNNIRKVLQRLQKANLKLSPKKCRFFRKEISYLGHIISADGVKTDPEKSKAVVDWPRPETVHDLRSFLGLCTYYHRFVRNFSAIARPLHKLTETRSNFNWTEKCEKSFNSLKQVLITSPILTYPRTDKEFILDTDASNEGIRAVLSQKIGNEECVITYFSKSLGKPERNYCVTRKELLAFVKSIEHFHHYLYGRKFLLRTDHASLR